MAQPHRRKMVPARCVSKRCWTPVAFVAACQHAHTQALLTSSWKLGRLDNSLRDQPPRTSEKYEPGGLSVVGVRAVSPADDDWALAKPFRDRLGRAKPACPPKLATPLKRPNEANVGRVSHSSEMSGAGRWRVAVRSATEARANMSSPWQAVAPTGRHTRRE
jgi:hypothetical protein